MANTSFVKRFLRVFLSLLLNALIIVSKANFTPSKNFLEGVKFAFEAIINAFNKNDKKTLKNLLTNNVFTSFEEAINMQKNNPEFQFYSLVVDSVEDVVVEGNIIKITVKITSEQFKNNDEATITKKQDTWTFQKEINSKSPIWLLSST